MSGLPQRLGIIAGRGLYPLILAREARRRGVGRIVVLAFRGETRRAIRQYADEVRWHWVGSLEAFLRSLQETGVEAVVLAGQIRPRHIFTVRLDGRMRELLRGLEAVNAETVFGAVVREIERLGIAVLPADSFMEGHRAPEGMLAGGEVTAEEWKDVRLGWRVGRAVSGLDVGQTVVVRRGVILAVEAFEGTDAAIRRAGRLSRPQGGGVVVKMAKRTQDMRFDIPVVGTTTLRAMRKARASLLVVEAGRTILLDRAVLMQRAARWGIRVLGLREVEETPSAVREGVE